MGSFCIYLFSFVGSTCVDMFFGENGKFIPFVILVFRLREEAEG